VRAREHRQRGVFACHRHQCGVEALERRLEHFLAGTREHQRIAEVVDVFRGAGEVHELQRRGQFLVVAQALLDEVLHRLDVVVGGGLDFLDPDGILDREVRGQRPQASGGRLRKRGQLHDAILCGQRQQPFHLDLHAGVDQAVLRQDRTQRIDLAGIAAVNRGQGEEGGVRGVGHGVLGRFGGGRRCRILHRGQPRGPVAALRIRRCAAPGGAVRLRQRLAAPLHSRPLSSVAARRWSGMEARPRAVASIAAQSSSAAGPCAE